MPFYIDPRIADRPVSMYVEKCWLLRARCAACGREGRLQAAELRRLPQDATVGAIVARLKCEGCGGSEGYVDYLQDRTATASRDAEEHRRRLEEAEKRRR